MLSKLKTMDKPKFDEIRMIAIPSRIQKLVEAIANPELVQLQQQKLSRQQFGFMAGIGCGEALANLMSHLQCRLKNVKYTYLLFVDFK